MTNIVTEGLKNILANNYALYLKTQNYHWNVTGPHFRSLHVLFEEQYNDLFTANDDIAERIRALGDKVAATFEVFSKASKIKNGNENADAKTMVKELADDNETMVKILQEALKPAQEAGDEVTVGMIIDRMTIHEKAAWMLRSSA